jgi:hypothetical protein
MAITNSLPRQTLPKPGDVDDPILEQLARTNTFEWVYP